nr:hypothetical protein [Tanacetum cinerariifolium]
ELQQLEHAAKLSAYSTKPSQHFNSFFYDEDDDDDDEKKTIPLRDIIFQLPSSIVITTSPPILPTFKDPEDSLIIGSEDLSTSLNSDDDDDEKKTIPLRDIIFQLPSSIVITTSPPVLPTFKDPEDSLIIGSEDLSTILEKKSDKFIKSSVEDLDPIQVSSRIHQGVKGLDDVISIPPGKEIDHLDAIPDSVQSLLNRDNSIIFLIEEFVGELAPINPIPSRIVESDFDPKEDIHLIKKLLNDDSSPHSLEE